MTTAVASTVFVYLRINSQDPKQPRLLGDDVYGALPFSQEKAHMKRVFRDTPHHSHQKGGRRQTERKAKKQESEGRGEDREWWKNTDKKGGTVN
jgi:hypothetical protein